MGKTPQTVRVKLIIEGGAGCIEESLKTEFEF
jgi:hypothetical protein